MREANSAKASTAAAAIMGEALSEVCGETLVPVGEPTAMLAIFMCLLAAPHPRYPSPGPGPWPLTRTPTLTLALTLTLTLSLTLSLTLTQP